MMSDDGDSIANAETTGLFQPETWEVAETQYEAVGPTAQTLVREIARAMEFDRDEYNERVTGGVVETARQALFAELLAIEVASRETFDTWRETYPHAVRVAGSDSVDRVAWHESPAAEAAVAATFQNEPDAAVGTVRRMAFNRLYRDRLSTTGPSK